MTIKERQKHLRRTLQGRGISDERVLDLIAEIRRDLFVPEEIRDQAYEDKALPIGEGQTISQPYIVALMTQELRLTGRETVLEVGTGSGYQAALLASLAEHVVTIDRRDSLTQRARSVLTGLGYQNITFLVGDGTLGAAEYGPFDGILVTAAAPDVPAPLYRQLKVGGRMVIPLGDEALQILKLIEKGPDEQPSIHDLCECRFVKLIGEAGWPEE